MKQKIEIEVDIPDGYELVGFGEPKIGEFGLDLIDNAVYGPFNQYDITPACRKFDNTIRLKKKPEYKWPDFIKSGSYLCMNKSGNWILYFCGDYTPYPTNCVWLVDGGHAIPTTNFNMSPPDAPSDWTKSLIRKP